MTNPYIPYAPVITATPMHDRAHPRRSDTNLPQLPVPVAAPVEVLVQQHRQQAALEAAAHAARRGLESAAAIREYGLAVYDVSIGRMLAYRDRPRDPEHQALVEAYAMEETSILRRDLRALEMIGVLQIAQGIGHNLLPSDAAYDR